MNPIFFKYGGLALRYSHLFFMLAFFIAYHLYTKFETDPLEQENLEKSFYLVVLGGVLGGRLSYIIMNWSLFEGQWLDVFTLWHGAFTLWGTLLGFIITANLMSPRARNLFNEKEKSLTRLAYSFPFFLSLSQWGLWFEGEGWGRQAGGFGTLSQGGLSRYPLWLYFFIGYLILSVILFLFRKKSNVFIQMLLGIGTINILLTPLILFVRKSDLVIYLTWTIILILGSTLVLYLIPKKQ